MKQGNRINGGDGIEEPLTDGERQFAELAGFAPESVNVIGLRADMRRIAYHEAAHAVAKVFTGLDPSGLLEGSIIPDAVNMGHVRSRLIVSETTLSSYPSALKRRTGLRLLLDHLAGEGAEYRLEGDADGLRWEMFHRESETWEIEGTDFFRARRIAGMLASTSHPSHRVLDLAARWTAEMLDLPEVWRAVERLAEALLASRLPLFSEEVIDICRSEGAGDLGLRHPSWRRRLFVSPAEARRIHTA